MDTTTNVNLEKELHAFQEEQEPASSNGISDASEEELLTCLSAETFGGRVLRKKLQIMLAGPDNQPVYKYLPIRGVQDIRAVWEHTDTLIESPEAEALAAACAGFLQPGVSLRNFLFGVVLIVYGIDAPVTIAYRGGIVWTASPNADVRSLHQGNLAQACLGVLETFPSGQTIDIISVEIGQLGQVVQRQETLLGNS